MSFRLIFSIVQAFILNPKDTVFCFLFASRKHLVCGEPFRSEVHDLATHEVDKLQALAPYAHPQLIGSIGLHVYGKSDIDIVVACQHEDLSRARVVMEKRYGTPQVVRSVMVQWKVKIHGVSADIDLISLKSSRIMLQLHLFSFLKHNTLYREAYETLKRSFEGKSQFEYAFQRIIFFEKMFKSSMFRKYLFSPLVEQYVFEHEADMNNTNSSYRYAHYQNHLGLQGFAKLWSGSPLDSQGRWIKNEITIYKQLSAFITKLSPHQEVLIPKLLGYIYKPRQATLLIERINASSIHSQSISERVSAFEKVFALIGKMPTQSLVNRRGWFWVMTFPFVAAMASMRNPKQLVLVMKSISFFIRHIPLMLTSSRTVFCHRDLSEWNVMSDGKQLWLIDFQLSCLAHPVVDPAILLLKVWNDKPLSESLMQLPTYSKIFTDPQSRKLFATYGIWFALYNLCMNPKKEMERVATYLEFILK